MWTLKFATAISVPMIFLGHVSYFAILAKTMINAVYTRRARRYNLQEVSDQITR